MENEESLRRGVELLESLSLSDSLADSEAFSLYSGLDLDFSGLDLDFPGLDLDFSGKDCAISGPDLSFKNEKLNSFNSQGFSETISHSNLKSVNTFDDIKTRRHSSIETHSTTETHSTDTNSTTETLCCTNLCSSRIKDLERKINLLETQNSQLIINSCAMYNTLIKHIQSLTEELNKYTR